MSVPTNNLLKSFFALLLSGAFVQILPLLLLPVLSRFYAPEQYQFYAIFIAAIAVLSPFVSFRLEHSIVKFTVNKVVTAVTQEILFLSAIASLVLAPVLFGVLCFYQGSLIAWQYLILAFIGLFSNVTFLLFNSYLAKQGEFKCLSIARLIKGGGEVLFALGYAMVSAKVDMGLVLAFTLSTLLANLYTWFNSSVSANRLKPKWLIRKYLPNFAKYDVPAALINALILQLPVLILGAISPASVVGYYSMANRITSAPSGLANNSVGMLFRNQAAIELKQTKSFERSFNKTFLVTLVMACALLLVLLLMPDHIWGILLGEKWVDIGGYIRILAPLAAIRVITFPLSYSFYLAGRLKLNFVYQCILLPTTLLSMLVPYFLEFNTDKIILCYVATMVTFYLVYITIQKRLSLLKGGNSDV